MNTSYYPPERCSNELTWAGLSCAKAKGHPGVHYGGDTEWANYEDYSTTLSAGIGPYPEVPKMRQGVLTQDADGTPRWNGKAVVYDFDSHRWVYPPEPKKPHHPTPLEWLEEWLEERIATIKSVSLQGELAFYDAGRKDVLHSVLDRVKALQ